ncbi:flagellar protein FlgN [Lentibacillus cibarius]|uniref:Flagellar protein FlgN n=1 Tax=Lentibacillus cibarius TaxID=2583219 RepID=A0A5S3QHS6_9BACI|nr:flagellar protein FlgN [Lentibacillus cibarius]
MSGQQIRREETDLSIQSINHALNKLTSLHESLLTLSKEKTEIVKEGSVAKLQSLLIKEQKFVQAIEQAEWKRQQAVHAWAIQHHTDPDTVTITYILKNETDKTSGKELEQWSTRLTSTLAQLKQQEHLNRELVKQSLQFVELSLDMLNPTIQGMNYGDKRSSAVPVRSVFDSKA